MDANCNSVSMHEAERLMVILSCYGGDRYWYRADRKGSEIPSLVDHSNILYDWKHCAFSKTIETTFAPLVA